MAIGVAHAWMDRAPLIAINDQYPGATLATGMRQVMNQHALFAPITKWQTTIHAKSVRQQISPGDPRDDQPNPRASPVRYAFERDDERGGRNGRRGPAIAKYCADRAGPECAQGAIASAVDGAEAILLAGLGVFWDKASAELVALAERLGAPVLTTSKCKGAIPEDHPLRPAV